MSNNDKMQERVKIIELLGKYKDDTFSSKDIKKDIEIINSFQNKEYICKVLFHETLEPNAKYCDICALLILNTIEPQIIEKQALLCLENKEITDEKKFYIISILKQSGIGFDYSKIHSYVSNPDQIAKNGVKSFLNSAMEDPEAQLDLLDFFQNIPKNEKLALLKNLAEEYQSDSSANALSLIAQLDIEQDELNIILESLIDSKSKYALKGLNYILQNYTLSTDKSAKIEKTIKEIKFSKGDFKNNIFAQKTISSKCYIGFIDGESDFTLVYSRFNISRKIDTILMTLNLEKGVTSTIGFRSISIENFTSIIKRLFENSLPVEIEEKTLKSLYLHYLAKNKETNTKYPYELIVWGMLLEDIPELEEDLSLHINAKLEKTTMTPTRAKKLACAKMIENWYFAHGKEEKIDNLIKKLEETKPLSVEKIGEIVKKEIKDVFLADNDFLEKLYSKLLLQAFIAKLAKLNATSSCAYSICFDVENFKILLESIIDKSIYFYLANRQYESENTFENNIKTNYTKEEIDVILKEFEAKWS